LNFAVTANPNLAPLSPYLNFDPAYISPGGQPEFIFPEGASHKRGRFELAFSQIGGSVMLGAAVGGANGLYSGLRDTALAGHTGSVRRTQ
jgi:import inner membrane translocase subunit TIM23